MQQPPNHLFHLLQRCQIPMITVFGVSQAGLISVCLVLGFFYCGLRKASCTAVIWLLGCLVNSADYTGMFCEECTAGLFLVCFFNVAFLFYLSGLFHVLAKCQEHAGFFNRVIHSVPCNSLLSKAV